ncbi:SGNH/GDSL hydrolase family protein [Umezawaea sp. Da 62-37]|uniref:SGNH/GDSL hydrolase family protein n=1 Tax=Umezawaea sp. Da 62-37 TaxID=3075927 RepID=UPI0028F6DB8C|nr:SGNH/GDSL hydrolase family protein [Umezawaea sp. Da 62-37]WNV90687.1 SGNH/GDSL hydrolase family protein [Umezawaea sp. Da 62-37]
MRRLAAGLAAVLLLSGGTSGARPPTTPDGWVGTWGGAAAAGVGGGYVDYSIRNIVHTSVGGSAVRVRLSNRFSPQPVLMGHVSVAVQAKSGTPEAVAGSMRELTFGGSPAITIPAGADVLSDQVSLRVPRDGDLLVTTYTPAPSGPVTYHGLATQTSFFTRNGDFALETSGASYNEQTAAWHYVTGVDVRGSGATGTVVAFGDSITDGAGATSGANRRWPDLLADRLGGRLGVVNSGISGNRLLLDGGGAGVNALAGFDHDVLAETGVRSVILLEGVNDIQQNPHQTDPAPIIAAYRQFIAQAHTHDIRVLGATVLPFKGWQVYDPTLEATRQALNDFIRTSGAFDAVIDFDTAMRDPADPLRMRAEYDSGDHLHPNDAGYQAMANAVNLGKL